MNHANNVKILTMVGILMFLSLINFMLVEFNMKQVL